MYGFVVPEFRTLGLIMFATAISYAGYKEGEC